MDIPKGMSTDLETGSLYFILFIFNYLPNYFVGYIYFVIN